MKFGFMAQNPQFGIEKMRQVLGVSRSGYYSHRRRGPSRRALENERLKVEITALYKRYKGRVGSPSIREWLRRQGDIVSEHRVARLMRELRLAAKGKRKYRHTTDSNHNLPVAPNRLKQRFTVAGPDKVWVSDITYVQTREGWLYLCIFWDLYSRAIVGYALEDHMRACLVTKALVRAYWRRKPLPGLLVHSDRGSQYASFEFRALLSELGMVQSMSRKGNCYDNAVAESGFHTLKVELIHEEDFQTRREGKEKIIEYIELYYNSIRLHSTLGYMSPLEFERRKNA
jgi:transposase InsO family protein